MKYKEVQKAKFIARPNRFIARVKLDGEEINVHVKNTGRCAELLVPGCTVYLEKGQNPARKTPYDLIAVEKGQTLINMDSAAPNAAVGEWLAEGGIGPLDELRAEYKLGDSRFDFYARKGEEKILVEVKGCTLEQDGLAMFPDAPTQRGLKHVKELTAYAKEGWKCFVLIVIQMKGIHTFRPNWATQPEFGEALRQAAQAGVTLLAMDCVVAPDSMKLDKPVPIDLEWTGAERDGSGAGAFL